MATTAPMSRSASVRASGRIAAGSVRTSAMMRWRSGHISAVSTAPTTRILMMPLTRLATACMENMRLSAGHRRYLGQLGRKRLDRPHQTMLDHVAGDRRQHQEQHRHGHRRQHLQHDGLVQMRQRRRVDADLIGIGDQPAHGGAEAGAHAAGKRHQHQRGAAHDEPGVDLLALDHVAALERFVQPLLCRVFCFFCVVALACHRAPVLS